MQICYKPMTISSPAPNISRASQPFLQPPAKLNTCIHLVNVHPDVQGCKNRKETKHGLLSQSRLSLAAENTGLRKPRAV